MIEPERHGITVSIHALLAECDPGVATQNNQIFVSIHALLAECDYLTSRK